MSTHTFKKSAAETLTFLQNLRYPLRPTRRFPAVAPVAFIFEGKEWWMYLTLSELPIETEYQCAIYTCSCCGKPMIAIHTQLADPKDRMCPAFIISLPPDDIAFIERR